MLNAMDTSELGLPVAMATSCRHVIARTYGIDPIFPALILVKNPLASYHCVKMIQNLQRENNQQVAAGLMVWAHTFRAMDDLELRPLGRSMWSRLALGFPFVESAAADYYAMTGTVLDISSYDQIPDGLGPQT